MTLDAPQHDLDYELSLVHPRGSVSQNDPDWYRRAVFYEVMVRSFADSDGTGTGDLAGLTSRLDYLQWLGVDCLWLPPFFTSPMDDGGYDVADYRSVQPDLGTLEQFGDFIDKAHDRGLRIIIDFVMNHTSDDHPWFEASRTDPDGPYGDYYVWSDDPEKYADARIIFLDTETSNWTFDDVRGQFYWHRFYSHQPDLNYENPAVLSEIMDALRFWLGFGVDGFRLDAVPYLIEEDGTNCENLPGTHEILKRVRAMVDAEFPGRVLLCEANQWPADVVEYFGEADECQMAFHFPVMPRLYLGLHNADRSPISEILAATPPIPDGCQWATFLRNHDELTLEMVSEADRQFMWDVYAPHPRMKSNLGIRRRLAPLVDNDPARIRLMHALLLGLPGSPVLYYGDEIGMGDDIWLPDRDGVRTPMQWAPDGGFSTADPDDFFLPMISGPDYGPERVNVAAQLDDPASLLMWLRSMLVIRRHHPVFGIGDFVDLGGDDLAIFAFLRSSDDADVVCVHNLGSEPKSTTIHVPGRFAGVVPNDLLRDSTPNPISDAGECLIELPPHGFAWLDLRPTGDTMGVEGGDA